MLNQSQGQSTLEYMVLLAGIVGFLVIFLNQNGYFQQEYRRSLEQPAKSITLMSNRALRSYHSR